MLRRQDPDDAQLVKDAIDTSLVHLKTAVAWSQGAPFPLEMLSARLAYSAAAFDAGTSWTFSIFDAQETRVLGGAALEPAEDALLAIVGPGAIETGYWLRADATGQGYATEATGRLVELAFSHLAVRRVVVCHDPLNVASEGVPRRLGFRCLGVVANSVLPGRLAADGTIRPETKIWVLEGDRERKDAV